MSSFLPFVVVAASLAVVAAVALGEDPQPATTGDGRSREPWTDRLQALLRWIGHGAGVAGSWTKRTFTAAVVALGERRPRRTDAATERRAREADVVEPVVEPARPVGHDGPVAPSNGPSITAPSAPPEGVLTTALLVPPDPAVGEVAGEPVPAMRPSPLTRLRSGLGLAALIVVLGLCVAAALGAVIALGGAALDNFVN